ncbi:hypothetical protein BGZ63DRAFT_395495 [Mariannaea sp. PMI_226]|nr:hypothetical protein BGZ63DRAFT_395495 [Mariannaea sp. PMI_226]
MIVLGWLSALSAVILTVFLAKYNALQPNVRAQMIQFKTSEEDIQQIYKISWIFNLPIFTTFYLCKGALLSMYLEIFSRTMVKRRIFLWATIIYVGTAYAVSLLTLFLLCRPIQSYWDIRTDTTCPPVRSKILFIVAWTLHFAGDILVFILPWTIIHGIRLRRTLKLGIYCTLLLGLITMTFSLLRFIIVIRSLVGDASPISLSVLWCVLECNLGLIITCIPSLRPYFTRKGENSPRGSVSRPMAKLTGKMRSIGKLSLWRKSRTVSHGIPLANGGEDSGWSEGKQSRHSDAGLADADTVKMEDVV